MPPPGPPLVDPIQLVLQALDDVDLVPVADPNTSSHMQRLLNGQALVQMAQAAPQLFNLTEIAAYNLELLRIPNPQRFLAPAGAGPPPDPKAQAALLQAQTAQQGLQIKQAELQLKAQQVPIEDQNRDQDRQAQLAVANMQLQRAAIESHNDAQAAVAQQAQKLRADAVNNSANLTHDAIMGERQRQHDAMTQHNDLVHQKTMQAGMNRHEAIKTALGIAESHAKQLTEHEHKTDLADAAQAHQEKLARMRPKPNGNGAG